MLKYSAFVSLTACVEDTILNPLFPYFFQAQVIHHAFFFSCLICLLALLPSGSRKGLIKSDYSAALHIVNHKIATPYLSGVNESACFHQLSILYDNIIHRKGYTLHLCKIDEKHVIMTYQNTCIFKKERQ